MKPVIITRTQPGADATAASVADLGFKPLVLPSARVSFITPYLTHGNYQALVFTSANGVRGFCESGLAPPFFDHPVVTVGQATRVAAHAHGFLQVQSADGDGQDLLALIFRSFKPEAGPILHLRGREVAFELAQSVAARGFSLDPRITYQTVEQEGFADTLVTKMNEQSGIILVHSPAAAKRVQSAVIHAPAGFPDWQALGLSDACIKPLENITFMSCRAALQPNENALMQLLGDM